MSKNYELENRQFKIAGVAPSTRLVRVTAPEPTDDSTPDVSALLQILRRRRVLIGLCTVAMLAVAALVCMVMTPQYLATSRVQVLNQQMGRLSLKDSAEGAPGYDASTALPVTLQTHVSVLQSDTLALQVIKELNLANTTEFRYDPLIKTDQIRREMAAPLDQAPLKRSAILKKFKTNLYVDSVSGTRLLAVSYEDPDPEMAAKIVNQLVSDFVEYNFQVGYQATTKATDFLGRQLVDLKSEAERSQERATELQKASGIFGTGEDHNNIILTRLEELNTQLTTAQANRIVKEAVYNLARKGNPELIAGLLGSTAAGGPSQATNSLSLIHQLRQQETELNAQYADAATKYGTAYPRLMEIKERQTALQSSIDTELRKVAQTAGNEYEVAASQESAARQIFEEQKAVASKMNDRAINYTIAKREAESAHSLYDSLTQKLKEADVWAGIRSSELNIVDPAVVPGRPAKPSVPLYLAVGALAGLMLGVIAAFVSETMDRTVRSPEEIENSTQIPILGIIPQGKIPPGLEPKDWLKAYGPKNRSVAEEKAAGFLSPDQWTVTEAFRQARTSLLLSWPDRPPKVLMMASPISQEGKSFTSLNLAAALAQNGGKVLLVDADLRRGTLSSIVKQHSAVGLSELLLGSTDHDALRPLEEVPGLMFMPAGALLSSPAELLGSPKMAGLIKGWREGFSYVVIDTPALLPVTDAVVLSPHVDLVIMVARFGFTQSQSVVRAIRLLRAVQVKYISILVNAMDPRSREYYPYRGAEGYDGGRYGDPHLLAAQSSPLRSPGGNL
jgi:succinoglycan biosynthesis transport protein ExoP